jgi:Lar family restriction alleviation protein
MNERESQEQVHLIPPGTSVPTAFTVVAPLPCPFCGGEPATDFIAGFSYMIECHDCNAQGSRAGTEAEAIAAWNRRGLPADAQPVGIRYRIAGPENFRWQYQDCPELVERIKACANEDGPGFFYETQPLYTQQPIQLQGAASPQGGMVDVENAKPLASSGQNEREALPDDVAALLLQAVEALEDAIPSLLNAHKVKLTDDCCRIIAAARARIGRE